MNVALPVEALSGDDLARLLGIVEHAARGNPERVAFFVELGDALRCEAARRYAEFYRDPVGWEWKNPGK